MNLLQKLSIGFGAIAICLLTHYIWPTPAKETTKTVTKIENHTITKIVKLPDGTTTTIIDSTTSKDKSKIKQVNAPNWHVSVVALPTLQTHGVKMDYQLQLERRMIGPIYAGIMLNTQHEAGLVIGLEF